MINSFSLKRSNFIKHINDGRIKNIAVVFDERHKTDFDLGKVVPATIKGIMPLSLENGVTRLMRVTCSATEEDLNLIR